MRDNTLMVTNTLPAADQVQKLDKRSCDVFMQDSQYALPRQIWNRSAIQLNDKFATVQDVAAFVLAEKASKRQELQNVLTTALKVDGDTQNGSHF